MKSIIANYLLMMMVMITAAKACLEAFLTLPVPVLLSCYDVKRVDTALSCKKLKLIGGYEGKFYHNQSSLFILSSSCFTILEKINIKTAPITTVSTSLWAYILNTFGICPV
jgi:hypothetical protein